MSGLSDIVTNPDGSFTIGGITYKDGKVVGPFNLETPPDGVTAEQWDAIQASGEINPALFPNLSGKELLTLSQSLNLPTKGSTLEIDALDLDALKHDFSAPAMYTDPNTGELLSQADYEALYGSLGNTGELTNPNVTINDDGTRVNTDPVTGVKHHFAADGTVIGVTDEDGVFTSYVSPSETSPSGTSPSGNIENLPGPVITNEADIQTNLQQLWDPNWIKQNIEVLGDNPIGGLIPTDIIQNTDGSHTVVLVDGSTLQVDSSGNISDPVNNFSADVIPPSGDLTPPGSLPEGYGTVSMDMLQNFFNTIGAANYGDWLAEGSLTADDIRNIGLSPENLANFEALYSKYDPSTYGGFTGDQYSLNPYNPYFGQGSGMARVYAYNPNTNNVELMSESEADALGLEKFYSTSDLAAVYPNAGGTLDTATGLYSQPTTGTTTDTTTDFDFNTAFTNWLNQNFPQQTTDNTGSTGIGGLLGLLGGYGRNYGNMYGGSYMNPSYGNPFFGGYGYGYGMNPYAGGIGSFYGNMGSGWSPYSTGYGYGSSPFFGGYGGYNYNQMPYNPYSSLYNQYTSTNPATGGYTGDIYTPEYQSWISSPYEGQKYTQGYQDYLSTSNPNLYNNLFGTA